MTRKRNKKSENPTNWFNFHKHSKSEFYRYVRDNIPLISSSVWAWVRLCFTPQHYTIQGQESEKKKAEFVLEKLGKRIFGGISRKDGVKSLLELFFLEIFTTGRFAGEIIPLSSGRGIEYFHTIDPFEIMWEKKGRWIPYVEMNGKKINLDNDRFFYYGLGADLKNPGGVSPISSIPFVIEIEERMLEDMSLYSHNAGTPRFHIKINPPEPIKGESQSNYAKRINDYFDKTFEKFKYLDPDDNIITWSDVEIEMVGGSGGLGFTWRVNREQVIEDVITGMKLFPWVVGRTHGTTKNWVQAQFNLLMQEVDSIQEEAKAFADWLRNTELQMAGIDAKSFHVFAPNQDPFILDKARTSAIVFDTVDKKVKGGYINKDDGAKELGYLKAYKKD